MKTILLACAHPDDIGAAMGGTAWLLSRRFRMHIVCATKGERGRPDWTMHHTAAIRQQEERAEAQMLGAELTFLNRLDGELFADEAICRQVAGLVEKVRPAAMFTLWPVDEHPDHTAISEIARKAYWLTGRKAEFIFYEAYFAWQTTQFDPDIFVDISRVLDRKLALARCHACQNVNDHLAKALTEQAAFRGGQAGCKHAEGFKLLRPVGNKTKSVLFELT